LKRHKHIILLGILLGLLVLVEYHAPKEPDWKPSFKKYDKIPFGSYIVHELLDDAFPGSIIEDNRKSIYLGFYGIDFQNTSLIIITDNFEPGHASLSALFSFVEQGNKAFISAEVFEEEFCDSLKFKFRVYFSDKLIDDSIPYYFLNPYLKADSAYRIKSGPLNFYFNSLDTLRSSSIATLMEDKINFFRIPYGNGEFFIHNQPYTFTNYNYLLNNNAGYAFKVFSYLKNDRIIWDENYKPGQTTSSPLVYILEQESLKAAWYLLLGLGFIFMVFGAKRQQRMIPVISPPENSSLEFAKTLGNLYLSGKNHKDIAMKKYNYWLDFLRENYFIQIDNPDNPDIDRISEKTGVNVERIIRKKKVIDKSSYITQEQLLDFNQNIEEFHRKRI
jgi:hypothetical protein